MGPDRRGVIARRFCGLMTAACWLALAAALVFALMQLRTLWGSLHGQHVGASIGVSISTEGPPGTGHTMRSVMVSGSTITAASLFSTICGIAAIWFARAFFARLSRGEAFTSGAFNALRAFAIATLLMQLQPVVMAVVTATSVAGFHMSAAPTAMALMSSLLQPGFAPNVVLLGLLVAMVAVLGRANQIAEDHAAIV